MLKEYMSKLPFLQGSQNRRSRPKPPERPPQPEEDLWPEGDPFAAAEPPAEEPPEAPSDSSGGSRPEELFAAGRDAYRAGDYPAALESFLQAAERGTPSPNSCAARCTAGEWARRPATRRP